MGRVLTNNVGVAYSIESALGVAGTTWKQLEPNDIPAMGAEITTVARSPISRSRQRRSIITVRDHRRKILRLGRRATLGKRQRRRGGKACDLSGKSRRIIRHRRNPLRNPGHHRGMFGRKRQRSRKRCHLPRHPPRRNRNRCLTSYASRGRTG